MGIGRGRAPGYVWMLAALLAAGAAAAAAAGEEPTGGTWRTIVLPSGDAIALPPPPAPGSAQFARELDEVRAVQASRGARPEIAYWNEGACLRWNEIARALVVKHQTNPPLASRVYALLSVAQHDALVVAWRSKQRFGRPSPSAFDPGLAPAVATHDPSYPSEHAVVAGASAAVLTYLFPDEAAYLAAQAEEHIGSRLAAEVSFRSDLLAGERVGIEAAAAVIAHAHADGSDATLAVAVPSGPGKWVGEKPLLPHWAEVRPWFMRDGSQFRPPAPPAYGSPRFVAALAEVRRFSDTRTPEQLRSARFWADGPGTATPPGHWNAIASDLIRRYPANELRAARALALLNMAMMDAGICCWDAKYTYWLIRPSQADPRITTPVGLPNFPSYTSGHSSFSGAAAMVLGYVFPREREAINALAEGAAISRVHAGIHYRFDSDVGLEGGRKVGALAVRWGRADGSP